MNLGGLILSLLHAHHLLLQCIVCRPLERCMHLNSLRLRWCASVIRSNTLLHFVGLGPLANIAALQELGSDRRLPLLDFLFNLANSAGIQLLLHRLVLRPVVVAFYDLLGFL